MSSPIGSRRILRQAAALAPKHFVILGGEGQTLKLPVESDLFAHPAFAAKAAGARCGSISDSAT
jgi:hypothetical protein